MEVYREFEAYVKAVNEGKAKKVFIDTRGADKEGKYFSLTCTAKNEDKELLLFQELIQAEDFAARHKQVADTFKGKAYAGETS